MKSGEARQQVYNCLKPVEISNLRLKLKGDLKASAADLGDWSLRPENPLKIRVTSTPFGTRASIVFGEHEPRLRLETVTIASHLSRELRNQLAIESLRLASYDQLILKLSSKYQIFYPSLVEELNAQNFSDVIGGHLDHFRGLVPDADFERIKAQQIERYRQDPYEIKSWDNWIQR